MGEDRARPRRVMKHRAARFAPALIAVLASWPCFADDARKENVDPLDPAGNPPPSASASASTASPDAPTPAPSASASDAPLPAPPASASSVPTVASIAPPPASSTPPVLPPPPTPTADLLAKIGILGGSVVMFASLLVLGDASATQGNLDATCAHGTCPRAQQDHIDRYNAELLYGGVGTLTGLVMIGVGVLIYKYAIPPKPTTTGWLITPSGFAGRF